MPDSQYFSKLRAFLCGRRRSQSTGNRRAKWRAVPAHSAATFALEPLEPRVLLAADLAGAVQAVQMVDPNFTQQAAVSLLETDEGSGANNSGATAQANTARLDATYGNLPLSFEANQGQSDSQVSYLARGDGYSLSLTDDGAMLSLRQDDGSAPTVLTMEMVGANPGVIITGEQLLPGVANYFIGNDPSQWRTEIPTYAQVQYDEVYAGIDLLYYGNQGQLEYDFVVAPGADPGTIQLRFTGADQLALNEQGDLLLQVGSEQLTVQRPVLYQLVNGGRQEISGSFVLDESGTVGFQVGAYDSSRPLIIDPVLIYSTYVGGSFSDRALSLAVDGSGNAYITGVTDSNNLPGPQTRTRLDTDWFVSNLNATGTAVLYTTYFGSSGDDGNIDSDTVGDMIAVDNAGNAYVGGTTDRSDFPTTGGAYDTTFNGARDGFITKLNAGGSLVYSTYLGGREPQDGFRGNDYVFGIAVQDGAIYVAGTTNSKDFPTKSGDPTRPVFQATVSDGSSGFITKLNPVGSDASDLIYSTALGGGFTSVLGLAVDQDGYAYVTGQNEAAFPIKIPPNPIQITPGVFGVGGPFVTKLNQTGTDLVYSRFIAQGTVGVGQAIAVDDSGNAFVAGSTRDGIPVTPGAFQTDRDSFFQGFVVKVNPDASLGYATYIKGTERLNDIAVAGGKVAVTSGTLSNRFVTTPDALQQTRSDEIYGDAIIAVLNPAGSGPADLVYATYLGGNRGDTGTGIAWDAAGNLYVGGYTDSTNFPTSANFPTTNPSIQTSPQGGGNDAFVTKIGFVQPNQAPVANNDPYGVAEDGTLTVQAPGVLTNDTDADNNPLTAVLVSGPTNGVLTLNADGSFTYTPTANFNGFDSFTYKANDGTADSNVATVSIAVGSNNDPPTAVNDTATVAEDSGATAIDVLANDSFAPDLNETLTITAVSQGSNGAVAITGNGTSLTYAPNANFFGNDTFTYTISDGNGGTATATVSVTVTPVNDAPTANAGPDQPASGGTLLTGTLVTLDGTGSTDLEGHTPLTFAWTLLAKPAGSTASLVNPTSSGPTFTPDVVGAYTVQLVVTDALGASSAPDTVQVSVTTLAVGIDIRPGGSPNNVNLGSGGVVQVAILSTNTFNAPRDVDPVSVTLASASVRLRGNGTPTTNVRDVNGDGLDDLIVHINTEALQLSESDTQATLDGKTFGGIPIRGTDSIRVVP